MTSDERVKTYAEWLESKDLPPNWNDDSEYVLWLLSLA